MRSADPMIRWGIVSTIKADPADVLRFVAYHLDLGAHRVFVHLDAPCPDALPFLRAHPKVRVSDCDAAYRNRHHSAGRTAHQPRQSANATRTYRRQAKDLDWLAHIDVDEFLASDQPIDAQLAALAPDVICGRLWPVEALDGNNTAFRAPVPSGPDMGAILNRIYPQFGTYSRRGMLSHAQGKLFVRCGLPDLHLRIHNAYSQSIENPHQASLPGIDLCHIHARNWEDWRDRYLFRHSAGVYRASVSASSSAPLPMTLHDLLAGIARVEGESGLRSFYEEFNSDTPQMRARLNSEGLLRLHDLKLERALAKTFPKYL